jgi:uncharacterized protein YndB with AHSA1/START domain
MPVDVDTVWRAWTRPEEYGAWFRAVPGSVELDVRPGGLWRLELRVDRRDGPGAAVGFVIEVVP